MMEISPFLSPQETPFYQRNSRLWDSLYFFFTNKISCKNPLAWQPTTKSPTKMAMIPMSSFLSLIPLLRWARILQPTKKKTLKLLHSKGHLHYSTVNDTHPKLLTVEQVVGLKLVELKMNWKSKGSQQKEARMSCSLIKLMSSRIMCGSNRSRHWGPWLMPLTAYWKGLQNPHLQFLSHKIEMIHFVHLQK